MRKDISDAQALKEEEELLTLFPLDKAVKHVEKKAIREALFITQGNKKKAASLLKIDYKTLLKKAREYGLSGGGIVIVHRSY